MKAIKTVLFACAAVGSAWCCPAPTNIEGVAFTSGEVLNLSKLESLGSQNAHYFKDSTADAVAIRYASHYSKDAMVFIGNFGLSYQEDIKLDCMGVILDLSKVPNQYAKIDKTIFNFAEAVKVELLWMKQNGIVSVTDDFIQGVVDSLDKRSNGGVQYWTMQKSVLGYNSWFTKDAQSGVWGTTGADGVNGVKSVRGINGCSVIAADFELPPQQLGSTPVTIPVAKKSFVSRITQVNTALKIQFQSALQNNATLSLASPSGKTLAVTKAQKGTSDVTVSLAGLTSSGLYYLVINGVVNTVYSPVMILK